MPAEQPIHPLAVGALVNLEAPCCLASKAMCAVTIFCAVGWLKCSITPCFLVNTCCGFADLGVSHIQSQIITRLPAGTKG